MRLQGWEDRLSLILEQARTRHYELGEHDCFRVACQVVEALTGVDRWPQFAGYHTRRECLALLARHGSSFEDAFDWFFACPHVDWPQARRGDIAELEDESGGKHLGVVNGGTVAGLEESGLKFYPLNEARCVWRID